jgi:hypothetical protein
VLQEQVEYQSCQYGTYPITKKGREEIYLLPQTEKESIGEVEILNYKWELVQKQTSPCSLFQRTTKPMSWDIIILPEASARLAKSSSKAKCPPQKLQSSAPP